LESPKQRHYGEAVQSNRNYDTCPKQKSEQENKQQNKAPCPTRIKITIAPFDIKLTPHFPNKLRKVPFIGVGGRS
jgi:hypothetical protein